MMYKRKEFNTIKERMQEPRHLIQVVMGPRQVGKSTVVKQVMKEINIAYQFFQADTVPATQTSWISDCWKQVRLILKTERLEQMILVIDEIQKIKGWSEMVKKEWDYDSFHDINIKVLLLGSSRVMLEKGLADSMQGRFEEIRLGHWSYSEMRDAFGFTLEQYIYYGGYPGAATLVNDSDRWEQYINSSIIDATINKDILQNTVINKPALLRQTFELSAAYSSEILSLTKMIGQLQDAGNTTTLSNYLYLLEQSGMVCGLQKYANDQARRRASIPKYQVYNNALKNIYLDEDFNSAIRNRKEWGRIFESAIGCHLVNEAFLHRMNVYYWRDGNDEVDFILQRKNKIVAIEVKSNSEKDTHGLHVFHDKFNPAESIIVGENGISAEKFLSMELVNLF